MTGQDGITLVWRERENVSVLGRVVFVLTTECFELVSVIVLQGRVLPFFLRFEEHGKRISTESMSVMTLL